MKTRKDLWIRIAEYRFDHLVPPGLWSHITEVFGGTNGSTRAFANKLTRKLGWTTGFARRAIAEYKKFVYLGVTSDFIVTPSKVIDQVWHEHLLFTQAYASFCRQVLWTEFNHHPELVPTDEQTGAFRAQYQATLDRYRREFNAEPPEDIWGVPKFKGDAASTNVVTPRKKDAASGDDTPLWMYFDGSDGHFDADDDCDASDGGQGDDCGDSGSAGDGGGSGCSGGCGGD